MAERQTLVYLDNLPDPDTLAEEIVENLESALGELAWCSRRYLTNPLNI